MIVKMTKVGVLCLESDQEKSLKALRDLGVVHLTHARAPEGDDLERSRADLNHVQRALEVLPVKFVAQPSGRQAPELLREIWDLIGERKQLAENIDELRHEILRIEPFGDFDPVAVRSLVDQGVEVRLYNIGATQPLPAPADASVHVLHSDKTGIYFVVAARQPVKIDAREVRLPEASLGELRRRLEQVEEESARVEERLAVAAGDRAVLAAHAAALEDEVVYNEARAGMGRQGVVAYLHGFAPEEAASVLREAARENGWGILLAVPAEDENVPTLLRNPAWVRPIKAIFDMIGILPGYQEVDISASFLLFLSVFFAMLIGDAGYGILFLVLTWLARRKFPAAPVYPFRLLQIMSVCTVIWGVITGVYFGMQPEALRFMTIHWLASDVNVMLLCFYIGAIHLTVAHAWNVARMLNSLRALAQIGWICVTWTMFFAARAMVLGADFPSFMFGVLAVGVVLVVLFMTPPARLKSEWFNHVMLPLNLVGNFVDVVSYLRLFAVGAASLAVASSFNKMAMDLGLPQPVGGLVAALILFFGHTLNILLCAMGVLVHGVRLNTLEFSSHIGIQWSGLVYRPFARRSADVADNKN